MPVNQIKTFKEWMRREDYGDREQLERCWNKAQEAARADQLAEIKTELVRLRERMENVETAASLARSVSNMLSELHQAMSDQHTDLVIIESRLTGGIDGNG